MSSDPEPATTDVDWFDDARLGMFIHWGLYSVAARHEWVMERERMSAASYEPYAAAFSPDLYDPKQWVAAAVQMGAQYIVVTAKHHEGFALWNSAVSEYTAPKTAAGSDLIRPLVDAARAADLRIGLYYSLIDWHHPEFPVDRYHPGRDVPELRHGKRNIAIYREYLHSQVRELMTEYGRIDYLFFDFSYPPEADLAGKGADDWNAEELLAMVRGLQPGILVNERLGIPGDLVTPEQYQPTETPTRNGVSIRWEACQTLNGSWGYDRDNHDFKEPDLLVRTLIDTVSKHGNLLLNVAPDARGRLDPVSHGVLASIGDWMALHRDSIRGAGGSSLTPPPDCRYTLRGNRLYVHVFAWPLTHLHLPDLADRVEFARFLHDGSEVKRLVIPEDQVAFNTSLPGMPVNTLTLELPTRRPDVLVPVIELRLRS